MWDSNVFLGDREYATAAEYRIATDASLTFVGWVRCNDLVFLFLGEVLRIVDAGNDNGAVWVLGDLHVSPVRNRRTTSDQPSSGVKVV